jgi:hypothetical protein
MIADRDIRRKGENILLGIALENAVLDLVTTESQLRRCLNLLEERHQASVRAEMGTFGTYAVALNVDETDTVSLFVDGPYFEPSRSQSAAIWLGKEDLRQVVLEALRNSAPL